MMTLAYVLRSLGRRRLRAGLGVLGIFLTVALLAAVQIGLDSVSTSFVDLVAWQAGKADVVITAAESNPWNPTPFDPAEVMEKLEGAGPLRGLAPRWMGIVQLGYGGESQYAVLLGLDPARERELQISGLSPNPELAGGTCALSRSLADRMQVGAGAGLTVNALGTGADLDLKLETVLDRQLLLPQEVRDYVVVNGEEARTLLGEGRRVHSLAGAFRDPRAYYDARDLHASVLQLKEAGGNLAERLGLGYELRLPKASAMVAFQNVTSPLRALFGVFALLALSVTALLIYSIVSVAVEERIREYAILRTVGAKRRDIFRMVLAESSWLCFLGVVPGVLGGMGVAWLGVKVVGMAMHAGSEVIVLHVSWGTLGLTLAAGGLLALGSSLVPAWQAVRWRIVDALDPLRRGQIPPEPPRDGRGSTVLLGVGLVLSLLAVVVLFVLPTAFLSGNPSLIGAVMLSLLLSILVGFTMVGVSALPWMERVLLGLTGWLLGPAADLARTNLARHRRRNTTTALMFILSVSLVILVASLVAMFSRTVMGMAAHFNGADFRLESELATGEEVKTELATLEGVERVSEVRSLRSRSQWGVAYDVVMSDLVGMKHLWVVPYGVDAHWAEATYPDRIHFVEGDREALAALTTYQGGTEESPAPILISESSARYLDVHKGDIVQMSFRLGSARRDGRFRVLAVCGAMPGFKNFRSRVANAVGSGLLMPLECFEEMTESAPRDAFQVRYLVDAQEDGAVQASVAREMREAFGVRHRFGVKSTREQQREATAFFWVTQVFFGLLLVVAVVISVFALMASMATTVIERRLEIGVLKALGLRRGQLFRIFLGETVALTLSAGLAGGGIGFLLAWLFVLEASVLIEVPVYFTMPYVAFAVTFGISLLAGAVAAHVPTRRLLRRPAAEILRTEV